MGLSRKFLLDIHGTPPKVAETCGHRIYQPPWENGERCTAHCKDPKNHGKP